MARWSSSPGGIGLGRYFVIPSTSGASYVVHGREVRLAARDLELGDVGPELGERTGRVEVAFEQVMHVEAPRV